MSARNLHSVQYPHNQKFSSDVLHTFNSEYYDWAITALFYSALHLVNNYCEQRKIIIPTNHTMRNKFIKKKTESGL